MVGSEVVLHNVIACVCWVRSEATSIRENAATERTRQPVRYVQ
ncbi:hypothetical protein FAES_4675 [Fibrella aestuarina BUZ 2]|uniref:Uncharacterized protein n=1 Tax=Fibrella aestuarina BUZ 2 TaxID=1166018 RepID=I0KEX1_9BACT|nr:hypothetical protein FAES_4675 [Fibrella aestuarina BUZ 2]